MQAGANGVAVISAIVAAADVRQAVTNFVARMPPPVSPAL